MEKRTQPKWIAPVSSEPTILPKLYLFNSLSSRKVFHSNHYCISKELFVPAKGKLVQWYICGPTVYDASHMGHARTYIAFDIIRRILQDYFEFDVKYVQNITDIDDKIIKRARQRYLMREYRNKEHTVSSIYADITDATRLVKEKSITEPDPDKKAHLQSEVVRLTSLLSSKPRPDQDPVNYLIDNAADALSALVDSVQGASVTDHAIFAELTQHFEAAYFDDMHRLKVLDPDVLVRVTEYVGPIIKFVEKIIANGFAYPTPDGCVYFDTNKFSTDPKHFYAKLVPTAYGDADQLATGEGELTSTTDGKRSATDFALWKASKPGEPSWSSPWGQGRPGWHIECSAMASGTFGPMMDIHSGGSDLKFPHHDNELAQSEACFGHSAWVNYFLHSGHLTISGCKMSKSLKNFITINDALSQYSARRIRLLFLLHSWRDTLDYSENSMSEAVNYEKMLTDFFYTAMSVHLIAASSKSSTDSNGATNVDFIPPLITQAKQRVYDAMCDSCDTRTAMQSIRDLVTQVEPYLLTQDLTDSRLVKQLHALSRFVLRFFRVVGIADSTMASIGSPVPDGVPIAGRLTQPAIDSLDLGSASTDDSILARSWLSLDAPTIESLTRAVDSSLEAGELLIQEVQSTTNDFDPIIDSYRASVKEQFGFTADTASFSNLLQSLTKSTNDKLDAKHSLEHLVWPTVARFLVHLARLRQSIRGTLLVADRSTAYRGALLAACDRMRDEHLLLGGVRLQDRGSSEAFPHLGLVDIELAKEEVEAKKKQRRPVKSDQEDKKNGSSAAQRNIAPSDMFRSQTDKYSRFDEKGFPTHDVNGVELSKSQVKKLTKLYNAQLARYKA